MITNDQLATMSDEEFIKAAKEEYKDLPRVQRRQKERELKENVKTMSQFTPKQLALMEEVIRYGVKSQAHEEVDKIIVSLDRCITAYLYLKYEDYLDDDVLREQDIISGLLDEDNIKISDILKKCKGDVAMAKNKMDKYEKEVKKVVNELLSNGVKQSKAIVILQDKFPMLSKAMLVNAFKKVKAEREEVKEDPEIIAAAEYIFPEIVEEDTKKKEDKPEPQEQATEEIEEDSNVITPVEEEKPVQAKSKLIVVSKTIVVDGEFGRYQLDDEGLTLGELQFGYMGDIEAYESDCKRELELRIAELKEVMTMA